MQSPSENDKKIGVFEDMKRPSRKRPFIVLYKSYHLLRVRQLKVFISNVLVQL